MLPCRALRQNNASDFDDLLVLPHFLFTERPKVLEAYRKRLTHILVDEFQVRCWNCVS